MSLFIMREYGDMHWKDLIIYRGEKKRPGERLMDRAPA